MGGGGPIEGGGLLNIRGTGDKLGINDDTGGGWNEDVSLGFFGSASLSPNISAAFRIKSSSERELKTLIAGFSGSLGRIGEFVGAVLLFIFGRFKGIVGEEVEES